MATTANTVSRGTPWLGALVLVTMWLAPLPAWANIDVVGTNQDPDTTLITGVPLGENPRVNSENRSVRSC